MSLTTYELSFFFKNVQKSHLAVFTYLDQFSDGPYDFLFFQELQGKNYCQVADINMPNSTQVFGTPIHPEWECLPPPAHDSQVAIYIHKHIFTSLSTTRFFTILIFSYVPCSTLATAQHYTLLTSITTPIGLLLVIFAMSFLVFFSFYHYCLLSGSSKVILIYIALLGLFGGVEGH